MDKLPVTVYTAVFGGYDVVRPPAVKGRHVLFTDGPAVDGWEWWPYRRMTGGARITARLYKITPYVAPVCLWLDGNVSLAVTAETVTGEWLSTDADIALFRHPGHDCLYKEAERVKRKGKDLPGVVNAQVERYRQAGFPEGFGLGETCVMAWRDNGATREFRARWWHEVNTGSVRDQLSFDFVRWQMGARVKVRFIDGGRAWVRREHPWFACKGHGVS